MDENKEKRELSMKYIVEFQKNKSKEAFRKIYNLYKNDIYYFSLSYLKNKEDSEEVVQETFLRVYKNLHKLTEPSKFKSWIFQIAHNLIIDQFRVKERTVIASEDYMDIYFEDGRDTPEEYFVKKETIEIIVSELEKMNSIYVQTAKLRYFDELSIKEISSAMEIPEGTVKRRLKQVRDTLRPNLEKHGITTEQFKVFTFPIFNNAFSILVKKNQMSQNQSDTIWKKIIASLGLVQMFFKIGTITKILLSLSVLTLLIGGYYFFDNQDEQVLGSKVFSTVEPLKITSITYDTQPTNKPLLVTIMFNREFSANEVHLKNKITHKDIAYSVDKNQLLAEITENGHYIIKTEIEEKEFSIDNINTENSKDFSDVPYINSPDPFLNQIRYKDEKLYLNFENQDVDLSKSYYEYRGKTYSIPDNFIIEGKFTEPIVFTICDSKGNKSTYRVSINLK